LEFFPLEGLRLEQLRLPRLELDLDPGRGKPEPEGEAVTLPVVVAELLACIEGWRRVGLVPVPLEAGQEGEAWQAPEKIAIGVEPLILPARAAAVHEITRAGAGEEVAREREPRIGSGF